MGKRVEVIDFINAWESSSNATEVANKTGLKATSVQARASKYRSEGVALKKMHRGGGAKFNVVLANEILAAIRAPKTEVVA